MACKCKCRLDSSVCNNKQCWNNDKFKCACKELIDKEVYHDGFIWNFSNCESECDKSCDVGEYLDYESSKCKKGFVDKLVEKCAENIHEVKIARIALFEHEDKCVCSHTNCIVVAVIVLTISLFCLLPLVRKLSLLLVLSLVLVLKRQFNELINGKGQRNKHPKLNLLFLQRHDQYQKLWLKLVNNRQKALQKD